jgi:hypothetical protein
LLDASVGHDADFVGHGKGLVLVMGHQDGGRVLTLEDLAHFQRQALAQIDVEIGKWLVEQDQSWGRGASARASATRCCWPPESSCG